MINDGELFYVVTCSVWVWDYSLQNSGSFLQANIWLESFKKDRFGYGSASAASVVGSAPSDCRSCYLYQGSYEA